MKAVSSTFRSHLDNDVTALCTCWKITRRDGMVLRFTDADQDVTRDGELYKAIGAYSRSAIESTSTLSVDNLEVSGMSTELALPVEELRAGAYDHAEVLVFMTSWLQSVGGMLKLRRGFFGEVTVLPNGTFTVELRGLLQRLSHTFTEVYSSTCRHDLGDDGCKVDLTHPFATEGAYIPFPLKDADFEELGANGFGRTYHWYAKGTQNALTDVTDTYSGTYAAIGDADGILIQDVDIGLMGDDFLSDVDAENITLTLNGWRKDDGDEGRFSVQFLDYDGRELKKRLIGYYHPVNVSMDIGEVQFEGDFTFEMWWANPSPIGASTRGQTLFFHEDDGDDISARHFYLGDDDRLVYRIFDNDTENSVGWTNVVTADCGVPVGEWGHYALVREGDTFRIYVNGELKGEGTTSQHGDFYCDSLGRNGFPGLLSGPINEVRIWDVARTQAEINEFRFKDLPTGGDNLVRYYPFDGDTDDYGRDTTGMIGDMVNIPYYLTYGVTPVVVAHRGDETWATTGYEDVGTDWVLRTLEDVEVPPHTRIVRVTFDHRPASGTPGGSRLDSMFGWFKNLGNEVPMPNFEVGADPEVWTRAGMAVTSGSNRIFRAVIDEPRADNDGWFQGGLVTFYSGDNAGASMEVKRWTAESGQIELFLSLPYPIKQGDLFTIYPGCDKSRIGCVALFNNVINFFGTPDVPGEDDLFRYADANE